MEATGIRAEVISALAEAGVKELTPIQSGVLPHCLEGRDVLAKAKTGTGKTFAFLVPTVERLLRTPAAKLPEARDPVRALVLSSARELGTQIVTQAEKIAVGLHIETIMGGSSIIPQRERLDPEIVGNSCEYGGAIDLMVATPGRLIEHINTTNGFRARLAACEVLVLDECDQLLDGGFQKDIEAIVAALPAARQTLCFSATVPSKMLAVLRLAMRADYTTVDCVGDAPPSHALIAQRVVVHSLGRSLLTLYASVREEIERRPDDYKILAFLPTARQAQFSAAVLAEMGLDVLEIHSRRSAGERTAASDAFRQKAKQVLLSSDVSARGVDYPDVSLVLQVGAPASRDIYVQRVGRTGRAGQSGSATLLLCSYEKGFLSQLDGLPISVAADNGADGSASGTAAEVDKLAQVQEAAARVSDEVATLTYRAWIVAMNGQRKALKWTKADIVTNANLYAREVLGRSTVPTLPRKTAVEVGLLDVSGLIIEDPPPTGDAVRSGEQAGDNALELKLTFDFKLMGTQLKRDAMAAKSAILALSPEATMALQETLSKDGEADVDGFRIVAGMLSAVMVPTKLSKSGSSSSVASLAAMSRNASMTSLASSSEQSSAVPSRIGSVEANLNLLVDLSTSESSGGGTTPAKKKKKATPEELKAATARMALAGGQLQEAMATAKANGTDVVSDAAVLAAQAELTAAKDAKVLLMKGK